MKMPNTWRYTDVYEVIISYITNNLDPTNYGLNFGIIALHEVRPRVIIRFTLKNTRNNRKTSWTQLLAGKHWRNSLNLYMRQLKPTNWRFGKHT